MMEATENPGNNTTYEPLEGRRIFDTSDSPELASNTGCPKDRNKIVFFALLTAGIGFVLPYNSFINASDYWQERFPGKSVALDMSMTYIIVALGTVLLNNVFLTIAPFRVRAAFGYIVSFTTLIFVALCEVAIHVFKAKTAYSVNLAAVSLVAMGCTVQQSSFYGFASMLPRQYTQAVMAGESVAGLLVSINRIITKLLIKSERVSTTIFFLISTLYIVFSYILHTLTIHSPFVRFHMKACAKIVLRPDDEHALGETLDGDMTSGPYGVLALESSPPIHIPPGSGALSFSNPVYELSNPSGGENIIETNLINSQNSGLENTAHGNVDVSMSPNAVPNFTVEHVLTPDICTAGKLGSFKHGVEQRWKVARAIYPFMACIALAYCVTLSLYPGIESEIISCNLGTWMPVLLMFTFNTADVIGKILAAVPYNWSRRQLILMSALRALLVPLLLLCCSPREEPVIAGETSAFIFTAALGVTNGLAGSLPMMFAPDKVSATLKEVTGNMMTLSYNVGLTAGSLVGYVFDSMLGPQVPNPCPQFPFVPTTPESNLTIITTVIFTTLSSTAIPTATEAAITSTLSSTINTSTIPTSPILPTITQQQPDIDNNVSDYYETTDKLIFLASTVFSNVTQIMLYDSTISGKADQN